MVTPPLAPPRAYSTPEASWPASTSSATRLLRLPRAGAVNSGMRVVVASNRHDLYGLEMTSLGWNRVQSPPPMGSALLAFASARNRSFILASRSGSLFARSSACEKSFDRSYNSHTSLFASHPFSRAAVLGVSHGTNGPKVQANQPSW